MKKSFLVYRVCTFMLCLVLMLVIFPISVFAAKEMFTTYQIDDVTITGIDTPTAGKTFDFTAEEASQKYNIIKVAWREQNGSNYITSTSSTASAGKNYTVYVVLEVATANHYFNTDSSRRPAVSSVTVNGNTASASNTQDYSLFSIDASKYEHDTTYQKYLVVMYTFPTVEAAPIESVEFDIPAPVPGERVPSTWQASGIGIDAINGKANNGQVNVDKFEWTLQDGTALAGNAVFEYGKKYTLTLTLGTVYGASFATDPNHFLAQPGKPFPTVTVKMNGKTATVLPTYDSYSNLYVVAACVFDCDTAAQIKTIELTDIDAPVSGKAPDYTFTGGAGYENNGRNDAYYKNGMCWSEVGSSYILSDGTQAFLPGKAYQVDIRIKAKEGYEFATNSYGNVSMTATVNGKSATVSGNRNEILVTYAFPATGNIAISKVGVTDIDAPVTGQSPDYTAVYSNVNYGAADYNNKSTQNGISWYNETDKKTMSTLDKFEEGKTYSVQIMIWTNDGYEFQYKSGSVNVVATVNGKNAEVSSRTNEEVTLYYTFPKIAEHKHSPLKVDEVNATCKEAGKKAYYFCPECGKNFEDAKCTKEIADINSWGKIEKLEHTGGKATCENRAICKNCGEYYGELAEHSFGSAWDYKDASGHAHKCKVCGINDTIISHSGGTAKCGGLAKCAECKAEYGEVMQHQWSETPNYTDKNGHAHKCTICGEHDTVVKHTPGAEATETSAQLCTVCGYMIKPKLSHEHSLAKMDEVDATCTTSGKKAYYYCKSCNAIFSDSKGNNEIVDDSEIIIEATGHKESKWKSDEDTHWKECTVKGCGEIVVGKEAHDFSKSGKCTVCSYRQESGDDSEQVSDTDDKSDTSPDGEKVDDEAPASDNTAMWIAVIACGIVALACIIVVAVVLTKKNKKN